MAPTNADFFELPGSFRTMNSRWSNWSPGPLYLGDANMSPAPSHDPKRTDHWSFLWQTEPQAHVLVIGDLMLDRYLSGSAGRVSQEAPVLILRHQRESENAGGAGNVACNLAGLGLSVQIAGAVGQDEW